jgi:hypothetical protein
VKLSMNANKVGQLITYHVDRRRCAGQNRSCLVRQLPPILPEAGPPHPTTSQRHTSSTTLLKHLTVQHVQYKTDTELASSQSIIFTASLPEAEIGDRSVYVKFLASFLVIVVFIFLC